MTIPVANLHLRRQAVWVVGCRIVGIGATLASNILAARLLGPAEFGTYLLVTTVAALGSLLAMAGLNEAALRFISHSLGLDRPDLAAAYARRAIGAAMVASVVASVVVTLAFAGILVATRHSIGSTVLLALLAVGISALAWQQLGAEMLRAFGDLRLASLFSGGQSGGPVSNLLFLAALGATALAATQLNAVLVVGFTVGSVCVTAPLAYFCLANIKRGHGELAPALRSTLSPQQSQELLAVGGMLLLNQLLAFATQQFDVLLAGGLLSNVDLGLYGAAKRSLLIAAMPVQMATLTIVSTIPRLYAQSRMSELERVVRSAANAAAVPSLIALGLLVLFPRPILSFFLRDSYAEAGSLVIVMAAGYLALTLSGNPQQVLTMTGRHRAVLAVNFASALVLVVFGIVGARLFGASGLAAGSAVSLIVQNGVLWWLARRELGISTHVGLLGWRRNSDHVLEPPSPTCRHSFSSEMVPSPEPLPSSSV